ncbi:hypothetical protein V500_06895 [Pseudogymnoascus sp. VKM F-4518 (FW-2643)]|nr:hypothetical protein V500_06895 [Pseudogymnoascus sp. VKM F-4518 (FW-2643)]
MASTAMIWFTLYEPSFMNYQLSVTIVLFTLSTSAFVLRHLPDITSYGVLTTLFLLILAPILGDCSPFQGRDVVASMPLFVCAVLFFAVELARVAKALDGLADRRANRYTRIDASGKLGSTTSDRGGDDMTDVESCISGDTLNELLAMLRRDPERIAMDTIYADQDVPFYYKWNGIGSSESVQLSISSQSPRTSVIEFVSHTGADGTTTYTPPRDRGPFDGYRARHNTPQMDPDERHYTIPRERAAHWAIEPSSNLAYTFRIGIRHNAARPLPGHHSTRYWPVRLLGSMLHPQAGLFPGRLSTWCRPFWPSGLDAVATAGTLPGTEIRIDPSHSYRTTSSQPPQ